MLTLTVILRLIHVVCGALWVGFVVFASFMLMPSMQEAGPAGGPVMAALQKRGLTTIPPILAILTLLSGLTLYGLFTGGFTPGIMTTPVGAAYGLGGTLAVLAFVFGMAVLRPAMIRMSTLAPQVAASTDEAERGRLAAELAALRKRAGTSSRAVAWMLILATALMAVARYL